MKITKSDVIHVAHLARLKLDEAAVDKFAQQIDQILDYVDTLNKVDTSGVTATSHAVALTNAFREDTAASHLDRDTALANAPASEDGAFVVPKVVG